MRLAGKYENDPQYDEVLAHIEEYRRELDELLSDSSSSRDEEVGRYYDSCYEIVEERMYDL